jgi:hypothetical protein
MSNRNSLLCYTATDRKPFAHFLLYFLLYGLDRSEATEILDTFPIVKRQDEAKYDGKFRTKILIDGYMKAYAAGNLTVTVAG